MNKKTSFLVWLILLSSMTGLMLVGCKTTTATPTITPTQKLPTLIPSLTTIRSTSTPTPLYFHFTPPEKSNIHLEFDYPSSWFFSIDTQYADFMIINLADPRFSTVPTPSPDDYHPTPNDFGSVDIWIETVESGQPLDALFKGYKEGHDGKSWITLLHEYKITVDGYDANVLEYQIGPIEFHTSLMFERDIFFVVEDQMYNITFTVSKYDRGGEFEQGYEYFFNSLKIVP